VGSIKILQIGLGRWGRNHLRNLLEIGVDLYLCDTDNATAGLGKEAGLPPEKISNDYRAFLGSVDAVDVVTPADSHYSLCLGALETGKDVFVEKPITLNSVEALELADRAKELNRIIQVGHIFRFDTATQWMKSRIKEGAIGRPRWMEARFLGFKRPRPDSGISFADSLHFIDLFNYLLNAMPESVNASFADVLGRGMEDSSCISLDYDGTFASVQANYFMPGKERRVAVVGEEASIVCDYDAKENPLRIFKNRHYKEGGLWKAEEGEVTVPELPRGENLKSELADFLECVKERGNPRSDAYDGYRVVKILEAAELSARQGKKVLVESK